IAIVPLREWSTPTLTVSAAFAPPASPAARAPRSRVFLREESMVFMVLVIRIRFEFGCELFFRTRDANTRVPPPAAARQSGVRVLSTRYATRSSRNEVARVCTGIFFEGDGRVTNSPS